MERQYHLTRNLLILTLGLVFILLSQVDPISSNSVVAGTLEAIGIAMVGYAPIQLAVYFRNLLEDRQTARSMDRIFRSSVKVVSARSELPILFAVDISGLITPPNRGEIDLRKFQRLRAYCEFFKSNPQFPPIVLFTGRSQGYVELMVQSLSMLNTPLDLPHVIENGSALYRATPKKVIPLVNTEQIKLIQQTQILLANALPNNEMEPKAYMITIDVAETETIGELREKVSNLLVENNLREDLHVSSTSAAVDLTPRGITKLAALKKALEYHSSEAQSRDLQAVVSLGDTVSDLDVLRNTGRAYCPAEHVDLEVRNFVQAKFGKDHVIPLNDIDVVIKVIERECGLRIS